MSFISPGGFLFFPFMEESSPSNTMGHLSCFMGGLLALGAQSKLTATSVTNMKFAKEITRTCYEMYRSSRKHWCSVFIYLSPF